MEKDEDKDKGRLPCSLTMGNGTEGQEKEKGKPIFPDLSIN